MNRWHSKAVTHGRDSRPDVGSGASGQHNWRVRSVRRAPSLDPNGSICLRDSINRKVSAWGSLSWHFYILDILFEPKQTPPTHLHHWFNIIVRLRVISSVFAYVIASSGTWRLLWLWSSCYSWWLPSPRWLGTVEEHRHVLVIARGHLLVIVRSLVPSPAECQKVTLVDWSCHWLTSLVGRFLQCPIVRTRFVQHLLAAEPPSVGWHNGD
jgi:hypothetical protein